MGGTLKMKQDKMHLINKLFNNETIRTIWNKEEEKYYISVVDIVGVLSQSDNPRNYWKVLKHRLKQEGNELVTNCNQMRLNHQMENITILMYVILKECLE